MDEDKVPDQEDPQQDHCPVCNKDLSGYTAEHRRKHIEKCMRSKPKYVYTGRPRGRPSKRKPIKTPPKCLMSGYFK